MSDVYEYANGRGVEPTLATFQDLLTGAARRTSTPSASSVIRQIGAQYGGAKRTVLEQCSTRMLPVLCGLYGLPVSHAQTTSRSG